MPVSLIFDFICQLGWECVYEDPDLYVFRHKDHRFRQLFLPKHEKCDDYAEAVGLIFMKLVEIHLKDNSNGNH